MTGEVGHLVPGVFAHVEASHPHVRQQHLRAGVGDEGAQARRHGQLQTGGVAPVLQLVGQQLHGHGLVLPERLLQEVHGQGSKLTANIIIILVIITITKTGNSPALILSFKQACSSSGHEGRVHVSLGVVLEFLRRVVQIGRASCRERV